MPSPTGFLHSELAYFFGRLSRSARHVLLSDLARIATEPLVTIFIAAFIWRASESLLNVAFYAAARYMGLPIAFWINGHLLRHINIKTAMWFGALSSGIATAAVVLFAQASSPFAFLVYGLLNGIGWGFYWGNRNYLALQETIGAERRYYFAVVHGSMLIANVVLPFIGGWLIVFGPYTGLFTAEHAYWSLFTLSLAFMILSALMIGRGTFVSPRPQLVGRLTRGALFSKRRLINLARGTLEIKFITTLLILVWIGDEAVLGTLTVVASILGAFLMYTYGRSGESHKAGKMLPAITGTFIAISVALVMLPQPFNVALYVIAAPILVRFFAMMTEPFLLGLTDDEMGEHTGERYSLIFDNELFVNAGRVLSIALIILLGVLSSRDIALLWGPFVAALLQAVFLALSFRMSKPLNASG